MKQSGLVALLLGTGVLLAGCAPSESEISEVRAQVVETFRHYDSLCVGLPYETEGTDSFTGKKYRTLPYLGCINGSSGSYSLPVIAASEKAWREAKKLCTRIENSALAEECWDEAESQYLSRPQFYPERSGRGE